MEVAHVDPVERRVHQVEQREHGGGALVAEPGPGQAEHRDAAQGQRHRLGHQQDHRARGEPVGGHEEVHDRREMIAPGVHLGQAHVGAGAPRQVPHELDVVAEIERVRREGQVTGDRDEREHERVGRHPDQDGPAGPHRGDRPRGQQHAQRHEPQEQEEEVLGPPGPVLATARPEHECGAEPRRGQDGRAVEQPGDDTGARGGCSDQRSSRAARRLIPSPVKQVARDHPRIGSVDAGGAKRDEEAPENTDPHRDLRDAEAVAKMATIMVEDEASEFRRKFTEASRPLNAT